VGLHVNLVEVSVVTQEQILSGVSVVVMVSIVLLELDAISYLAVNVILSLDDMAMRIFFRDVNGDHQLKDGLKLLWLFLLLNRALFGLIIRFFVTRFFRFDFPVLLIFSVGYLLTLGIISTLYFFFFKMNPI
jgi:hypothetical protein